MGNQGTRAKLKLHRSSRVLLPGLFNHRGIGWLVFRSYAPLNVRVGWLSVSGALVMNCRLAVLILLDYVGSPSVPLD
jgi:hypothetical protein